MDMTPEAIAKQLAAEAATRRDQKRRETAQKVLNSYYAGPDYFDDDFPDTLEAVFKSPKKADRLPIKLALLRKYADTKASVFEEPAILSVVDSESDTMLLQEMADLARWNDRLQQANVYEHALGTVHLTPRLVKGQLEIAILTPAATIVFQDPDDPSQAIGLAYRVSQTLDTPHLAHISAERWKFWTADETWTFEMDTQGNISDRSEAEPNPWGRIPVVKVDRLDPADDEYWCPPALDVFHMENAIGVEMMALYEMVLSQGYSKTWSRNMPSHLFETTGPLEHYAVENQREGDIAAEVGVLNMHAQFEGAKAAIEFQIQQAMLLHNLPAADFKIDGQAESGVAKMMSRIELVKERKREVGKWRLALGELFGIVRDMWNTAESARETAIRGRFSEGAELAVDFADAVIPMTEMERLEVIEKKMQLGLMSEIEALQEFNPDLDVDAAQSKLDEIAAAKRKAKGGVLSSLVGAEQ